MSMNSRPEPQIRTFEDGRKSRWGLDEGDMSLIDLMLEMTPTERLTAVEGFAHDVEIFRRARRL